MFELGILVLVLVGLGLVLSLAFTLLGLVLKVIILPFQLGFWLMKGVLGFALSLIALVFLLPVIGVALPALLIMFAIPLSVVALIVWLVRRTVTAGA
jgi:hypothetical protein